MKKKAAPAPGIGRPLPPASFSEVAFVTRFAPAPELAEWVRETILEETGPLFNPAHVHLRGASIGWLWASDGYMRQGRRVLGLTERVQIMGNPWAKARALGQLSAWFGEVPDFLITLDGFHCGTCGDADFCALVEHHLYRIAHACDEFGAPQFTKEGAPRLTMIAADVEEFVGVVRRYGIGEPDSSAASFVISAAAGATLSAESIAKACGSARKEEHGRRTMARG